MNLDRALVQVVENQLRWEPSINEARIRVTASNGVVTLSGHVGSYAEKLDAEIATKRVLGVRAVANELAVQLSFADTRSDEDVAMACLAALESNASVPHERIKALVSNGWVTLEGTVEWRFQRTAAEAAIRSLIGITGITNALALAPCSSAGDVLHQIEEAFKRSAAIDSKRISVAMHDGRVILQGRVRSWAELDEAECAAWAAPGVTRVINELSISP